MAVTVGIEPERRGDERGEGLDVRAGDQDVARFQRRVGGEQAEHDLAEHLDLPVRTVTGVHLHGPVAGSKLVAARGGVVAQVALKALQQRRRRLVRPRVMGVLGGKAGQAQLKLADVAAERAQQGVVRQLRGGVGAAGGHPVGDLRDPVPQRGGGVRQPQVHVAAVGEGGEHGQVVRRQAGGAEQREPLRQGGEPGVAPQRPDGGGEPLRRVRRGDPRAQRPPHLRLPPQVRGHVRVVAGPPRVEQFGAVRGVGGEEAGQVGDHREPAAGAAQVCGEGGAPRPAGARVDDLHERPHRAGGVPRVVVRGDAGGPLDGSGDDLARRGEGDVRAHPVAPAGRPEPVRQAMGEPPLHAAGGHGDDLRDERVGHRRREHVGESVARVSERSARCRCSTASPTSHAVPDEAFHAESDEAFHAVQPKASPRRVRACGAARRAVVHNRSCDVQ